MDKTVNKSSAKGRTLWIIGLFVISVALVVAILGIGSRAAGGPYVEKEDTSYIGHVSTASSLQDAVEKWQYVIRANSECDAETFAGAQGYNGNLTSVAEGSNTYTPANQDEIERFDGNHICFQASDEDGSNATWLGVQMRFSDSDGSYEDGWPEVQVSLPISWSALTAAQKTDLNPYDCPEPIQIDAETGRCVVGDGEGLEVINQTDAGDPGTIVSSVGGGVTGFTVVITRTNGTYTARVSSEASVQQWRYIVQDESACNEQNFPQGGPSSVQIDSNSYTTSEADLGKNICFAAHLDDGNWLYAGTSFAPTPTPQDPEDEECPEGSIQGYSGGCIAPGGEGEPCDLGGIGNSEGQCVPCPTGEGYVIVNNTCVLEAGDGSGTGLCPASQVEKAGACVNPCEPGHILDGNTCVSVSTPTHSDLAADHFDDISATDSYAAAVGFLLEQEITTGCDEDSFCPDRQLTRREFVTFLYRLLDQPKHPSPGSEIFDDVEAGSYADEAIGWAHHAGVTTGCDEDSFCPRRTVTKAHVATFLYRLTEGVDHEGFNFEDIDENAYYANAADWAVSNGVVLSCRGVGDPTSEIIWFCPGNPVTRSDAATFIYNFAITPESWGSADLPIDPK